jgi:hypothetical protein
MEQPCSKNLLVRLYKCQTLIIQLRHDCFRLCSCLILCLLLLLVILPFPCDVLYACKLAIALPVADMLQVFVLHHNCDCAVSSVPCLSHLQILVNTFILHYVDPLLEFVS